MRTKNAFQIYYTISPAYIFNTHGAQAFRVFSPNMALTASPMHSKIKTGSIIKLQIPPSLEQRGTRKMTVLQKARMNLYAAMESGKIEEILQASRKLDELIVHQMGRQYGKKKAEVA